MNNQTWIWNRQTNMLVAKAGMEKPEKKDFTFPSYSNTSGLWFDGPSYTEALNAYEAHLATLPAPIECSKEFAEAYKDKPEGWEYELDREFVLKYEVYGYYSGAQPTWDRVLEIEYHAHTNEKLKRTVAYPIVKEEQENQDTLWEEMFHRWHVHGIVKVRSMFSIQRIKK